MTIAKKRPAALRGRDGGPARKQSEPPKVTLKQIADEYRANLDAQDADDEDEGECPLDAVCPWGPIPSKQSMLDRVLDHVQQKSVDFLRVGDKRGEELMDELHRELEQLR